LTHAMDEGVERPSFGSEAVLAAHNPLAAESDYLALLDGMCMIGR